MRKLDDALQMLQGVYEDSTFYEVNQFFDFSTSLVTMLIFIAGADNYAEAASGFTQSLWYAVFFMFGTIIG